MTTPFHKYPQEKRQFLGELLLVSVLVLIPSVFLLYFAFKASANARYAVRQRLVTLYESQVQRSFQDIRSDWDDLRSSLALGGGEETVPEQFAALVRSGQCDSIVYLDQTGQILYPTSGKLDLVPRAGDFDSTTSLEARALLDQARKSLEGGSGSEVIAPLIELGTEPRFSRATDSTGRLIAPSALLFALERIDEPTSPVFQKIAEALVRRVNDYSPGTLPSAQRRFLMLSARGLLPEPPLFPTLEAEQIAAVFLESDGVLESPASGFRATALPGVWAVHDPEGTYVALFREQTLQEWMNGKIRDRLPDEGLLAEILPPGKEPELGQPLIQQALPSPFTRWKAAVGLVNPDQVFEAAGREVTFYTTVGLTITVFILLMGVALVAVFQRQLRLTRLKNTLIATVSHELKTPLSSVRMLVDTILEGRCVDRSQEREYLELIARENLRLSRLIDNFLTFSRMERNKHAFQFESVPPESIIRDAVESVRERFDRPGCELQFAVDGHLPEVRCDRDAMVTVLLNLIDNAYKYSKKEKRIRLGAKQVNGFVRFEVEDNGVGIPRRAKKRIFERFYQVEQGLSREQGGVGLGLSIVRFILDAHGGRILLESEPGKGTTFFVDVPIAGAASNGTPRKDLSHAG